LFKPHISGTARVHMYLHQYPTPAKATVVALHFMLSRGSSLFGSTGVPSRDTFGRLDVTMKAIMEHGVATINFFYSLVTSM
jgi:hypothetical protein